MLGPVFSSFAAFFFAMQSSAAKKMQQNHHIELPLSYWHGKHNLEAQILSELDLNVRIHYGHISFYETF